MRINSIGHENRTNIILKRQNNSPSFGRAWEEHISWGANYIKEKGKTNFKLFSFPDAKAVLLELTKNAKLKTTNWWNHFVNVAEKPEVLAAATPAAAIGAISTIDDNSKLFPMTHKGEGIYELNDIDAKPDDGYRFVIVEKNGNVHTVKDPYSKKQENIHGYSSIYEPDNYEWKNKAWLEGKDPRRIKRNPNEKNRGIERLIINEVNIPTLSLDGTFDSAKKKIDDIAKHKNATAIEIMPVENTYSRQWGYDGVDKFAVNEKLGGAVGLKKLVDYAHGKGLNVIIDIVPNHIGTDGNYLTKTGPYIKCSGVHGDKLNYEGDNNKYVRDWMTNSALWWANEFKVDGIRFDLTSETDSDWLLRQIVVELNEHNPDVFLIAEDHKNKRHKVTDYYFNNDMRHEEYINLIDSQVDLIGKNFKTEPWSIGFDSEWDSQYKDSVSKMAMSPNSNLMDNLDTFLPSSHYRVHYAYSHDEIGNWDGTRFIPKYLVAALGLYEKVNAEYDSEGKARGQKAAQVSQKLAELAVTKQFANMSEKQFIEEQKNMEIHTFISKEDLVNALNTAIAKQRLILGTIYTTPGPKMFFQGDDEADLSYFKFFREFSDEKSQRANDPMVEKEAIMKYGYDSLEEIARPDSIVGRVKFSGMFKNTQKEMRAFTSDLRALIDKYEVLKNGEIPKKDGTYKDNNHNVHIHKLQYGDDEVLIIKNFGQGFHQNSYEYYGFPNDGTKWTEIFSSDDEKYGGMGYSNQGRNDITNMNQHLSLAPNSFIILKKVS